MDTHISYALLNMMTLQTILLQNGNIGGCSNDNNDCMGNLNI